MKIWKQEFTLEGINNFSKNTLLEHLDIQFTEYGDDYMIAKMPVDKRTHQPLGLLHGGASVVLAESLGSVASTMCIEDIAAQTGVGLEINANHLRSVRSGFVYGKVTPIKIGRSFHVWRIVIEDENGRQTCESRITMAIIDIKRT